MEVATSLLVGKHHDVLKQLRDGEPSNLLETEAVIEDIRDKKGYLDPDAMQLVEAMPARNRDKILRAIKQMKETEANYTRRFGPNLCTSYIY
jgi:hypothetical protein